jgi:hypothetical protein
LIRSVIGTVSFHGIHFCYLCARENLLPIWSVRTFLIQPTMGLMRLRAHPG